NVAIGYAFFAEAGGFTIDAVCCAEKRAPCAAAAIDAGDGSGYAPPALRRTAYLAPAIAAYAIAPGVCASAPRTPALPWPPVPAGQLTEVDVPTLVFHAGLTCERYSVKTAVSPLESLR